MNTEMQADELMHISLLEGQARALIIKSTHMVEKARVTHKLGRVATAALGRLLTITALMGAQLKGEGDSVTCLVRGDGPLGNLMAVARPDLSVKGYVDNPDVDLARVDGKLPVGDAVGHHGTLTVVKDMGMGEPYSGQVKLVSGELGEDFAMYYTVSEQTPSLVSVGVLTKDRVQAAGGLLVQMLPGASEAAIQSVEMSAGLFAELSKTMLEYDLDGAVAQLLSHLQPVVLEKRHPAYRCDCSRERVERALISLGQAELTQMIDDLEQKTAAGENPDPIFVDCHFCNRREAFTAAQLADLLDKATRG
ncbi:MAG: Hsp33 family molecular chaperone HslO [Clostridia bacterium]